MAAPLLLGLSWLGPSVVTEQAERYEAERDARRHELDAAEEEALASREAKDRRDRRERVAKPH